MKLEDLQHRLVEINNSITQHLNGFNILLGQKNEIEHWIRQLSNPNDDNNLDNKEVVETEDEAQ